ncbi:hypothetical protein Tco_1419853 [Tanacetum coccineum]
MEALKFADSHNMVAYLEKSMENADFDEIVDFLNANPIRYALTVMEGEGSGQPTEPQHTPTTVSPSIVVPIPVLSSSQPKKTHKRRKTKRKATEISQSSGPTTLVADETVHEERRDSVERAATTVASLDAEQDNGNINRTQSTEIPNDPFPQGIGSDGSPRRQDTMGDAIGQTKFERTSRQSYDSPLRGVNAPRSDEDRIELKELMEIYTKLSERILYLENIKAAQDLEITNLKKRVKKLEKKKKSRTPQLKRRLFKVRIESSAEKSLGDQEDASKQGRNEIDQEEGISWFQEDAETQGRYGHDTKINTTSTSITTASINITTVEPVTTASAPITTVGVSVSTAKPSTPLTTTTFIEDEDLTIAQTLMKMRSVKSKEKSKEKGVSNETATRLTRGVIIKEASETTTRPIVPPPPQQQLDPKDKGKGIMQEPEKLVKVKVKYQIEHDANMAKRLQDEEVRLEREREEEASNAALIEEWDSIEARIDADTQLAERLQAEEREQISVEEQARQLMELIAAIKKLFAVKRAEDQRNKPPTKAEQRKKMCTYMKHMGGYKDKDFKGKSFDAIKQMSDKAYNPMDTESSGKKAESSRKKTISKKRAGERPSKESAKRQKIKDDAEKAELKACLEIVPRDDSAVNIESLATNIQYPEGYDRLLWGDLITLSEPSEEDEIWKAQQDYTLISSRLFDSCGVHLLLMDTRITIHMLVEKKYPLTQEMLSRMLSRRLEVDHECEMAFELLGFIKSRYKK